MDSVMEQQRYMHEERERLVEAMAREMMRKKSSHADQLSSDHKVKKMLDRHTEITQRLLEIYSDRDGMRREEIRALGHNENLNEFDARLRGIRDYYRRRADTPYLALPFLIQDMFNLPKNDSRLQNKSQKQTETTNPSDADASLTAADTTFSSKTLPDFTDEEGGGRYLDLVKLHERYINLPHIDAGAGGAAVSNTNTLPKIDYISYLRKFDHLFDIGRDTKITNAYRDYLSALTQYLIGFVERTKPLHNLSKTLQEADGETKTKWDAGQTPGWEWYFSQQQQGGGGGIRLDLNLYRKEAELHRLGGERLKGALKALGMKCGGTLDERAARLWQTKYKSLKELDEKLFVNKAVRGAPLPTGNAVSANTNDETSKYFDLARNEGRVYKIVESLLADVRRNTVENVQRKQARTADERAAEDDDDAHDAAAAAGGADDDDDDEDTSGILYNPKNLPLGWDNKPIPYWLYKLHGLNLHYKCEICGNQEYRGPKIFQQHFTEWRHAHGMRCLGIPNSAHFHNIIKIEDALSLWDKLRNEKQREQFKTDVEEEFEDSTGNVVNRKMFDDLRRQGLL